MKVQVSAGKFVVDETTVLFLDTSASLSALSGDRLEVGVRSGNGEFGVIFDVGESDASARLVGVDNGEIFSENGIVSNALDVDVGGGHEAVHGVIEWLHAETHLDVGVGLRGGSDFEGEVTVELVGATIVGVVMVKGKLENVVLEELGGDGVVLAETVVVTDGDGNGSKKSESEGEIGRAHV